VRRAKGSPFPIQRAQIRDAFAVCAEGSENRTSTATNRAAVSTPSTALVSHQRHFQHTTQQQQQQRHTKKRAEAAQSGQKKRQDVPVPAPQEEAAATATAEKVLGRRGRRSGDLARSRPR